MTRLLHPRFPPRRDGARTRTWWGRAWLRAVEEAAYAEAELVRSRTLARAGRVGGISTGEGSLVAAVEDGDELWTVSCGLPVLDRADQDALVETVAAEAGRVAQLLTGALPIDLVEHAEEAGVELLPYGGELESTCTCAAWTDPCVHALAVLHQVAWLVEADPLVLFQLRGLGRDELLGRLHARSDVDEDVLEQGVDAALRAARVIELLAGGRTDTDRLF